MVQLKIFSGTLAEIESAFNAWCASLMAGVQINASPATRDGETWVKEVVYMLPVRPQNGIAVPKIERVN